MGNEVSHEANELVKAFDGHRAMDGVTSTLGTSRIEGVDIATQGDGALADWRAAHIGFGFRFTQLVAEVGKTIAMVTHDLEAAAKAPRMVHLEKVVPVPEGEWA